VALRIPITSTSAGEEFFQHRLPLDRSSMTNWRMARNVCSAVAGELAGRNQDWRDEARRSRPRHRRYHGAAEDITFPTDAKLLNRAREKLVKLAKSWAWRYGSLTRRSGKFALIQHQRYAHCQAVQARQPVSAQAQDLSRRVSGTLPARSTAPPGLRPHSLSPEPGAARTC